MLSSSRRAAFRLVALAIVLSVSPSLFASSYTVSNTNDSGAGSLRQAIIDLNAGGGSSNTITFTTSGTITLASDLPVIQTNVTISGNNATIDGASTYRGLFIANFNGGSTLTAVTVTIQNLTIQNAKAAGGSGADGGGGGAGLGAAVFVANLASVTLSNVSLLSNAAAGGAGASNNPAGWGGGGGMGGNGTAGNVNGAGGGGGLGRGANGGATSGGNGSTGIATNASSGGSGNIGGSGGAAGGGGGGGDLSNASGGGGGGVGGSNGSSTVGGSGSFGGGGGGVSGSAGTGGYGGGGGGGGTGTGGGGGFGGGGGGAKGGISAGAGGFGGGAGANAASSPGGGGGAMGGAIFVQSGGALTLNGPLTVNGNAVSAGAGASGADNGSAFAGGLFIAGDTSVPFSPSSGETQTINDVIADQTGSGGTGGNAGAGTLTKSGAGTLVLAGANTYTGATTVSAGTLRVTGSTSASSAVTVASGATLGGDGTIAGSVTVNSGGTLSPGNSPGAINTGSLTLNSSSTLAIELNGETVGTQYDQVNVTGTVNLGGSTLSLSTGFTPTAGTVFIIVNNDGSDAVTSTFSGLAEGATITDSGRAFQISYAGGSSNNDVTLTFLSASTTTALTTSINPTVFGQSTTFTATVTSGGGTPTGTVTFKDGSTTIGTGTLNGSGVTTFATATLSVGTHSMTAVYGGDTSYATSTSSTVSQVVNQASTTSTLGSSVNPSVFGQSVTVTATIAATSPGSGTPTGTVTFKDGSTTLGTGTLNGSGVATFATATLSVGTHSMTAVYGGDTNFATSTSSVLSQVVTQASTTSTLGSSVNPSAFGQSVTVTATVAATAPGSGTPTGTVTFKDGSTTLGTGTLDGSGVTTFATSTLSAGVHSMTAAYGGDTNFATSTSGALSQTVNKADQTITFNALPNGRLGDPPVALSAQATSGLAVTFSSSTPSVCTVAGETLTLVTEGTCTVAADQAGNATYNAAPQVARSFSIGAAIDLAVSLTAPASAVAGQMITYTATVRNLGASTAPGVVLADSLPPLVGFISATPSQGTCTAMSPITCSFGSIVSGGTVTTTIVLLTSAGSTAAVTNTVSATAALLEAAMSNNTASATTTLSASADVAVTMTGPSSVVPGGANLVYTLTVTNNGPSDAASVSVSDPTPAGLTFVSNGGACGAAFPCALGTVAPGATRQITTTFSVPSSFAGSTVTNTATASTSTPDAVSANNSATVAATLSCGVLSATPTTLPRGLVGVSYSQTVALTNGASPVTFALTGALPAGVTLSGGVVAGTPRQQGAFPITVTATDGNGCRGTFPYTLLIGRGRFLAIGAGGGDRPVVRTFGLANATPLTEFNAYAASFSGGVAVALGDVNGDGTPDIITGSGPGASPLVKIFDGGTNAVLTSFFAFDASMMAGVEAAAGDINGDGVADIVAVPGSGGSPVVRVFDGRTGTLVREFLALPATFAGGLHVGAGDVNGDGFTDIMIGSGPGTPALVQVYDGLTGAMVRQLSPYVAGFGGGVYVAAGDVNGDGFADIITGAGPGGGPMVRVFDGVTGAAFAGNYGAFFAYTPLFTGGVHVAVGDLDGDGRADVITGPGAGGGPHVRVFSGVTSSELTGFYALTPAFGGGVLVAGPPMMPRMAVDAPAPGATLTTSNVRAAGWALEEMSTDGPGWDAIHAWAYPVAGGAPTFVGATSRRVDRSDVAAMLGGEFLQSGFEVSGTLPAGTYDLVIAVRNARTGMFDERRIVRVTVR